MKRKQTSNPEADAREHAAYLDWVARHRVHDVRGRLWDVLKARRSWWRKLLDLPHPLAYR